MLLRNYPFNYKLLEGHRISWRCSSAPCSECLGSNNIDCPDSPEGIITVKILKVKGEGDHKCLVLERTDCIIGSDRTFENPIEPYLSEYLDCYIGEE
jgi:hypothetical protein